MNVLTIDYRGFGDSEGTARTEGINDDARAAWDWLVENGAKPEKIIVLGESMGAAVGTELVYRLESEGMHR